MDPFLPAALQYIREVKSSVAAAGDGRQIYHQFLQTLKQYRKRNIDSSILISTVQTLFRNHPNLLDGFKHFMPSHQSAAAAPAADDSGATPCVEFLNRVSLRSCVYLLNRFGAQFDGGGAYCKFLESMHAYSRGEITAGDVYDEVVGLFRNNDDLVHEFVRFLPESHEGQGSKKRKIDDQTDQPGMKRRGSSSGSRADEEVAVVPPRLRRPPEKFRSNESKAAKMAVDRDNDMEDALCEIDVRIGRLESATRRAVYLYHSISDGRLSPAGIRLDDEHFTALELVCIRNLGRKFPEYVDVPALVELMEALRKKKKKALEIERAKIVQKWNRIRLDNLNNQY